MEAEDRVEGNVMGEAYREYKVLRTLAKAHAPLVKSDLQRKSKINYSTFKDTLQSLENKNLVKVYRYGSTKRKFSMIHLNDENPAIQGLVKFFEESE